MISVYINDKHYQYDHMISIYDLLQQHDYTPGTISVAINATFIPQGRHQDTFINDGDQVDILAPMQGG